MAGAAGERVLVHLSFLTLSFGHQDYRHRPRDTDAVSTTIAVGKTLLPVKCRILVFGPAPVKTGGYIVHLRAE